MKLNWEGLCPYWRTKEGTRGFLLLQVSNIIKPAGVKRALTPQSSLYLTCSAICWLCPEGPAGCCAGACGATEWPQAWRWPAAADGWSSGSSPAGWCWDEPRHLLAPELTSWGRSGSGLPPLAGFHPPEEREEDKRVTALCFIYPGATTHIQTCWKFYLFTFVSIFYLRKIYFCVQNCSPPLPLFLSVYSCSGDKCWRGRRAYLLSDGGVISAVCGSA